jgi:cytochrome c-type biogenesis protein CcmH
MTLVYIGVASIVVSLLLLWVVGQFMAKRSTGAEPIDVAGALRELLLARAEGRIDQAEFDRRQAALHAAVLEPAKATSPRFKPAQLVGGAVTLLLVAAALVLFLQTPPSGDAQKSNVVDDLAKLPGMEVKPQANAGGDLNTAVKKLADKMANDPGNGDGWLLLAKTYGELRRFPEAAEAYAKAAAILPPDAGMLADWADAYVMSRDRKWDDEGRKIVKRALATDPKHVKSLALAGSEAFGRGDYKAAIDFWKRMKAAAPADSMDAKLADANIAEATAQLSGKRPVEAPGGSVSAVTGTVMVSPKLAAKVLPQDTLFVTAKGPDGSGPPLAVQRFRGSDLPVQFKLDDSLAIMPGRTISQVSEVVVSAKVSRSGQAEAQAGDIYGAPVKVKVGAGNLKLELDQER